jgi:hypothetical protein
MRRARRGEEKRYDCLPGYMLGRGERERGGERERERERLERCDGCSVAIAVGGLFRSDSMSHMHFNTSILLLGSSLCLRNA